MPDELLVEPAQRDGLPGCCLGFAVGCLALPVLSIVLMLISKLAELATD